MKRSKILIFTFLFTFICLLFTGLKVSATTPATSELITVKGAQVRTAGTAGIRFVGNVDASYDKTNVTAYGISIAFGDANAEQIVVGGVVNEKSVLSAQVSSLDGTNYYINLTDIPTSMYAQKVTARSYVVDNGEYVYSDTATTRTLGQVALAVKNAGQTSDLIEEVFTTLSTTYKSSWIDSNGNVYITNAVYEAVPTNLEKEFVKDWNAKFGTTWTEVTYSALQASASEGNEKLNCSGSNMFAFFNDETYGAKWQWLLNYLNGVSGGKVHPKRQIAALFGDGTAYNPETGEAYDTYVANATDHMNSLMHLSASITNFFNGGSSRDINNDITFSDSSKYSKVAEYNNVILANNPKLFAKDSAVELPYVNGDNGYDFTGYKANDVLYTGSYTIGDEYVALVPTYTPTDYMVTYYDGNTVINELTQYYNIETADFNLPEYTKEGYAFKGWYTTSTFDAGTEVTSISKGTTGNKVFYAKMEETDKVPVNVTLNPSGGSWDVQTVLKNADILKKATLTRFLEYQGGGLEASLHNSAPADWWAYILLNETAHNNTYEIVEIVNKKAAITKTFDYVIMWHDNLSNADTKAVLGNILSNASTYVGKYVVFEDVPAEASSACSIKMNVIDSSEFTKNITMTLTNSETLLTPTKSGDPFVGWKSSVDQTVSKTYPGYSKNPGNITYTAVYESEYSDYSNVAVTFNTNGGTMSASSNSFTVTKYSNSGGANGDNFVYMCDTAVVTYNNLRYQYKILLAYDSTLDAYKVVATNAANTSVNNLGVTWTHALSNVTVNITSYASVGNYITIDKDALKAGTAQKAYVYPSKAALQGASSTATYSEPTSLPTPTRSGFTFVGWRSSYDNSLYLSYPGFKGVSSMTFTAEWKAVSGNYDGLLIGSFDTESWVAAGKTIQLSTTYANSNVTNLTWKSETPSIATVTSTGTVKGVSEGMAIITVSDPDNSEINFTFYVTVFASDPTGLLQLIAESNNADPYMRKNLVIGDANDAATGGTWGYYADLILGSASQLFFGEDFKIHNDYLHADNDTYGTFASLGQSVEFVTFHYGADTPYAASAVLNGGKNLASYGKTQGNLSYHFGTGNDGAWASFNEAYTTYHAGSGNAKTSWYPSGVYVQASDPKYPITELRSDNYFYINGRKTSHTNTVKSGAKLSEMGFATKVVNGQYYMPNFRYDLTYARLCTSGGNYNSIAIESSVRKGSDLWLTWHYSAQLCAYLLNKYNLPMTRLVGHNFWSGKWCPQPMLENDLEIWYIFRDMVEMELSRIQNFKGCSLSLSSNSSYITSNGRIKSQPKYSQCVTYDVTYTYGGKTNTVTLSTIIPGSTR